jgi:hypothetical protein
MNQRQTIHVPRTSELGPAAKLRHVSALFDDKAVRAMDVPTEIVRCSISLLCPDSARFKTHYTRMGEFRKMPVKHTLKHDKHIH